MILRLHLNTDSSAAEVPSGVQNGGIQLELSKKDLDTFVNVLAKIEDQLNS